jgi:hypothetical protein
MYINSLKIELLSLVKTDMDAVLLLERYDLINDGGVYWRDLFVDVFGGNPSTGVSRSLNQYAERCNEGFLEIEGCYRGGLLDYSVPISFALRCISDFIQRNLVYGVGINDYEGHVKKKGNIVRSYSRWADILERCYCEKRLAKTPLSRGNKISENWKFYSNYKKWDDENYIEGYSLDKGIIANGSTEYSAETTTFVPSRIKNIISSSRAIRGEFPVGVTRRSDGRGKRAYAARLKKDAGSVLVGYFKTPELAFIAYKKEKESYIKEVALDYYSDGRIDKRVFDALCRYEVELDD